MLILVTSLFESVTTTVSALETPSSGALFNTFISFTSIFTLPIVTVVNIPIPALTVPVVVKLLLVKSISPLAETIELVEKVKFFIVPIPTVFKFLPTVRSLPIVKLVFGSDNESLIVEQDQPNLMYHWHHSAFNI